MMPPMRTKTALISESSVGVAATLKLPTKPRLKMRSRAPQIIPLIPASDNMRLVTRV